MSKCERIKLCRDIERGLQILSLFLFSFNMRFERGTFLCSAIIHNGNFTLCAHSVLAEIVHWKFVLMVNFGAIKCSAITFGHSYSFTARAVEPGWNHGSVRFEEEFRINGRRMRVAQSLMCYGISDRHASIIIVIIIENSVFLADL